jgi:chemotaxis protein CheX
MHYHEEIVKAVCESTSEVFTTMLGLDVNAGAPYQEGNQASPSEGVVALIGLAGNWVGSGALYCSAESACAMASAMMQQHYETINDEVLDTVAEVTNMVVGNVKTALEEVLGVLGLSVPTVIYGRNFMTRSAQKQEWTVVPFECAGHKFRVKMCLMPSDQPQPVRHGFSQSLVLNT